MKAIAAERLGVQANWRHRLWSLLALALLGWVAWRVISLGMADHFAGSDPGTALGWRSQHADALIAAAQDAARLGDDPKRAAALARNALRANPLLGRAYRVLAELAATPAQAERLYAQAAARAPRDIRSLAWLADRALLAGKYPDALALIDQILRVEPELLVRLFPALATIAAIPAAQPAMAALLQESPPWRAAFLIRLARDAPDLAGIAGMIDLLRKGAIGLAEPELSAWIERLVKEKQWGAAYLIWVNQLPPERRRTIGNVYDGGFEFTPTHAGFDWRLERIPGVRLDLAASDGIGGAQALRVEFEHRRVPFRHVRQLMALPPGRYRLEGRARLDGLQTERGLVWTVACAESRQELANSDPLSGSRPWRPFLVEFVVPESACGGQWLTLRLPARIPAEQRIGGTAWFDDMRVARVANAR